MIRVPCGVTERLTGTPRSATLSLRAGPCADRLIVPRGQMHGSPEKASGGYDRHSEIILDRASCG